MDRKRDRNRHPTSAGSNHSSHADGHWLGTASGYVGRKCEDFPAQQHHRAPAAEPGYRHFPHGDEFPQEGEGNQKDGSRVGSAQDPDRYRWAMQHHGDQPVDSSPVCWHQTVRLREARQNPAKQESPVFY